MSLNIKNEETVRLVRELAAELDLSMTAAITDAVQARLAGLRTARPAVEDEAARLLEMWGELGKRLGREYLSQDFDQLLYDERGLPR